MNPVKKKDLKIHNLVLLNCHCLVLLCKKAQRGLRLGKITARVITAHWPNQNARTCYCNSHKKPIQYSRLRLSLESHGTVTAQTRRRMSSVFIHGRELTRSQQDAVRAVRFSKRKKPEDSDKDACLEIRLNARAWKWPSSRRTGWAVSSLFLYLFYLTRTDGSFSSSPSTFHTPIERSLLILLGRDVRRWPSPPSLCLCSYSVTARMWHCFTRFTSTKSKSNYRK